MKQRGSVHPFVLFVLATIAVAGVVWLRTTGVSTGVRLGSHRLVQISVALTGADIHGNALYVPLVEATKLGHDQVVSKLLELGADPNRHALSLGSPLYVAALLDRREIGRRLLSPGELNAGPLSGDVAYMGAEVDETSPGFTAPLTAAASKGHTDFVKMLLARGADVNATGSSHGPPVVAALENGKTETALLLVEAGAELNVSSMNGIPALTLAVQTRSVPLVKAMLERGARVAEPSGWEPHPELKIAVEHQQPELVKLLLEHGAPAVTANAPMHVSGSLLALAVTKPDAEIVETLIRAGANPEKVFIGDKTETRTPLMLAAVAGQERVIRVLLRHKVKPDRRSLPTDSSPTALHLAAESGHAEAVRALLEAGADPSLLLETDDDRYAAVHLAASKGQTAAVRVLLEHGVKPDARWSERIPTGGPLTGPTPLTYAAAGGHLETMTLLLERGADVRGPSGIQGMSVLVHTPLRAAVKANQREAVALLLERGAEVDDYRGWKDPGVTPLMVAAQHGLTDVLWMLLERKPVVDAKNAQGWTALALAVRHGQAGAEKLLRDAGAKHDAPGREEIAATEGWSGRGYLKDMEAVATGVKVVGYGFYGIFKGVQFLHRVLP